MSIKNLDSAAKKLKFILYARKSSEAKERQALSVEDQITECKQYAEANGLEITIELQESKSSFKPGLRPKFNQMIELLKEGTADGILTWKPDRLCRNPEEGGKILQLLQDGVIKAIKTPLGDEYTVDSDHLVLQIHFGMANQFSRNLSQNVRRGLKHKAQRGEYSRPHIVGFESFGERGRRNIRPHPFEAPLVKKAFELMAATKYSLGYICDFLDQEGLRTKRGKKIWRSHLHAILTTTTYYGVFYRNGEAFQGSYEPIITKQLFDDVQLALTQRSKPQIKSHTSPYNGLIRCKTCDCSVTTTIKEKFYPRTGNHAKYLYHHCTHRKGNCFEPAVSTNELESQLTSAISQINIDKEVWQLGIELLKSKNRFEMETKKNNLVCFQKRYNYLRDKLSRLLDLRADGEITKEEYQDSKDLILQEQIKIKNLMDDNGQSVDNWLELAENFLNTACQAADVIKDGNYEEKRNLILTIGENLFLTNKKLEFSFKKPFDVLLKPKYRTSGLRD